MGRIFIITSAAAVAVGTIVLVAVPSTRTKATRLFAQVGFADEPLRAPEVVDLVVDTSDGSGGTRDHVDQTLSEVLPWTCDAPGSAVRITIQGARAMDARVIATVVSAAPTRTGSTKARIEHTKRCVATNRELIAKAMEPVFAPHPPLRNSPIAETISWVALFSLPPGVAPGTARRIILITDAREVSQEFGDFECGTLPTPERFIALLRAHGVLAPTSLEHIRLHFTFTEPKAVDRKRCPPMTVARIGGIKTLWVAAANNAGALEVTFITGAITLRPQEDTQ